MTLKEKFWNIIKKPQTDRPSECEKIADDFAIGFAQWIKENSYKWVEETTIEQFLEIYKKEKGL